MLPHLSNYVLINKRKSRTLTTTIQKMKRQRLVLIPKPAETNPTDPSSFRPLDMLDTTGKLYERMVLNRLEKAYKESGGLSDSQNGFRKR